MSRFGRWGFISRAPQLAPSVALLHLSTFDKHTPESVETAQRHTTRSVTFEDSIGKGYSASGIIINKHPGEVTLVLESGQEMTVAEAVKKFNEAREKAQA